MKLYYNPNVCSLAVHIALKEAGLPHTLEKVDLKTHLTESGKDFYEISPKGYVPTLVLDNGDVLTEVISIQLYIASIAPDAKLTPPTDSIAYTHMVEWMVFVTTELHKTFWPIFFDAGEKAKEVFRAKAIEKFAYVSKQLGDQDYLMGEQFTLPDAYLFTVLRWAGFVKLDLSPYPNLKEYQDRVNARPMVQKTMEAEKQETTAA